MKLLLTLAAILGDAALIYACHEFSQNVMFFTLFPMWPGAAALIGYLYLCAGGSVVLTIICILEIWKKR